MDKGSLVGTKKIQVSWSQDRDEALTVVIIVKTLLIDLDNRVQAAVSSMKSPSLAVLNMMFVV